MAGARQPDISSKVAPPKRARYPPSRRSSRPGESACAPRRSSPCRRREYSAGEVLSSTPSMSARRDRANSCSSSAPARVCCSSMPIGGIEVGALPRSAHRSSTQQVGGVTSAAGLPSAAQPWMVAIALQASRRMPRLLHNARRRRRVDAVAAGPCASRSMERGLRAGGGRRRCRPASCMTGIARAPKNRGRCTLHVVQVRCVVFVLWPVSTNAPRDRLQPDLPVIADAARSSSGYMDAAPVHHGWQPTKGSLVISSGLSGSSCRPAREVRSDYCRGSPRSGAAEHHLQAECLRTAQHHQPGPNPPASSA